jgi:hypothetical protein
MGGGVSVEMAMVSKFRNEEGKIQRQLLGEVSGSVLVAYSPSSLSMAREPEPDRGRGGQAHPTMR